MPSNFIQQRKLLTYLRYGWHSPTFTSGVSLLTKLIGIGVLLPIALSKLSLEEATVWLLFIAIMNLITLADFGFSPTFIRIIAYSRSSFISKSNLATHQIMRFADREYSLVEVISAMVHIYRRIGVLVFVIGGILGTLAVAKPIAEIENSWVGWSAWVAILISVSLSVYGGIYAVYLQGQGRIAPFRRLEAVASFITTSLSILIVVMGGGLLGLVFIMQVGSLLVILINRWLATKSTSDQVVWNSSVNLSNSLLEFIWTPAWRSGLGVLVGIGVMQGSAIIYAQLVSPLEAAAYLLSVRLAQGLISISNVPFYVRLPLLAQLYSEKKILKLLQVARMGMLWTSWTFLLSTLIVGLYGTFFLELMGSQVHLTAAPVWWMLALAYMVERVGAMYLQLYTITNVVVWHIANGVTGAMTLMLMPILYLKFGIIGLPFGLFLSCIIFYSPYAIMKNYKEFKMRPCKLDFIITFIPVFILLLTLINSLAI